MVEIVKYILWGQSIYLISNFPTFLSKVTGLVVQPRRLVLKEKKLIIRHYKDFERFAKGTVGFFSGTRL